MVKDGKPYCRGHGLAEASRRPACEILPIPEELSPLVGRVIGACPECRSVVLTASLVGTRERIPLSYGKLTRAPREGDVVFNPITGGARHVSEALLPAVVGWVEKGATLHHDHRALCVRTPVVRGS